MSKRRDIRLKEYKYNKRMLQNIVALGVDISGFTLEIYRPGKYKEEIEITKMIQHPLCGCISVAENIYDAYGGEYRRWIRLVGCDDNKKGLDPKVAHKSIKRWRIVD